MKQCICIGMRDLTPFFNRRDTTKLLLNQCPTLTNWISRDGFGISSWLGDYRMRHTTESVNWPYYFIITTTCTTAADATFTPLPTNELAMGIMKKKMKNREKWVDRLKHDVWKRNHIWSPFLNMPMINFLICINTHFHHDKDYIQLIL